MDRYQSKKIKPKTYYLLIMRLYTLINKKKIIMAAEADEVIDLNKAYVEATGNTAIRLQKICSAL